jgi:DNA-binding transcriptional LysR family regulator
VEIENPSEQVRLVAELVTLARPLPEILADFVRLHQDVDAEIVTLERGHLISVLERYLAGEIDPGVVESWANAVDLQDEVGVPDDDQVLRDALFGLANPSPAETLTPERARALIATLRKP